jgi:hypothetical protein
MKHIFSKRIVMRLFAIVAFLFSTSNAFAQYYMQVYKNNGQIYRFLVSEVDSVQVVDMYDAFMGMSVAERLETIDGSERFVKALKTTKLVSGDDVLKFTYYDCLMMGMDFTIWLPNAEAISDDEWYLFTKENKSVEEHRIVGQKFLRNHISYLEYIVKPTTNEKIRMLSKKYYQLSDDNISGISYEQINITCANGVVHRINGKIPYENNIYEYITESPDYKDNIGQFLKKHSIQTISLENGLIPDVDKNDISDYIDSITYNYNVVLKKFGHINEEDSNYVVVLPTSDAWSVIYDSVKKQFDYTTMEGADSLQEYYTNSVLFTDMFFNMNQQRNPLDSVTSTLYYEGLERSEDELQHKYYNPYSAEGLFRKYVVDSVICSNGKIYLTSQWVFDKAELIDRPIKIEGEDSYLIKQKNYASYRTQIKHNVAGSPKVSGEYVMQLRGENGAANYDITYNVYDNMKGKYKVGIVTVRDAEFPNPDNLPVQFLPTVSYGLTKILEPKNNRGRPQYIRTNIDNPIDTLWVPGVAEVPQANYGQEEAKLEIRISVKTAPSTNDIMFLDCIIFKPVPDDYVEE